MGRLLFKLYRWTVFKCGDIRWQGWSCFPTIATFKELPPKIRGDEIATVMKVARPCDVLVSRHNGVLSNLGLGGGMIHAALCIGGDHIIEAVSDDEGGVRDVHLIDGLRCDAAVLLRPRVNLSYADADVIVSRARQVLGFKYDIFFDFDMDATMHTIDRDIANAKKTHRLCCTETVCYAYNHLRTQLELYRVPNERFLSKILRAIGLHVGHSYITADMLIESNFDVVWASSLAKPEWFQRKGCGEKLVEKVSHYWKSR